MTELLKVGKDSKVLEIGTGSGYQAAVLVMMVKNRSFWKGVLWVFFMAGLWQVMTLPGAMSAITPFNGNPESVRYLEYLSSYPIFLI